jgi:hypothetical protein
MRAFTNERRTTWTASPVMAALLWAYAAIDRRRAGGMVGRPRTAQAAVSVGASAKHRLQQKVKAGAADGGKAGTLAAKEATPIPP